MSKTDMKRKRRLRAQMFWAFWLVLLASFSVFILSQLNKYAQMEAEEARIYTLLEEEDKRSNTLREDMDYHLSDAFVEKIAREQMDLLHPDEKLFYNDARQE